MKNKIIYIFAVLTGFLTAGCEDFLDKSPDQGVSEDALYKDYNSITGHIDYMFSNYLINYFATDSYGNGRDFFGGITDEFAVLWNGSPTLSFHTGNWLKQSRSNNMEIGSQPPSSDGAGPVITRSYSALRIANRVISNIDKVLNITEEEKTLVLGQAYFYRAWFYFQVLIRYGGLPKLDKVYTGFADDDLTRMTYHESHDWMMEDIEKAISMLPDFWEDRDIGRPNKAAAMAFKSMAMLYDASPLMQNDLYSTVNNGYDKQRAAAAAVAAQQTLDYLDGLSRDINGLTYAYRMVDASEYKNIFYFSRVAGQPFVHPEWLWYNRKENSTSLMIRRFFLFFSTESFTGPDAASGFMPTQNMVDMFEKKGQDGIYYPIDDPRSGYDSQKPFTDRDPRFTNNIITPGEEWGLKNGKPFYWTTYYSTNSGSEDNLLRTNPNTNLRNSSGYICRKYLWPGCNDFTNQYTTNRIFTCFIRYAQVYLDLAEASFEATGSATAIVPGCMSAEQALNVVRNRIGVTNVASDIVNNPGLFRKTLRRERTVELMFENHRWFDIRRWMMFEELFGKSNPIKGMRVTPITPLSVPAGGDIVTDPGNATLEFTYEVIDLPSEVRGYTTRNYWYPFTISELSAQKNLVQTPGW